MREEHRRLRRKAPSEADPVAGELTTVLRELRAYLEEEVRAVESGDMSRIAAHSEKLPQLEANLERLEGLCGPFLPEETRHRTLAGLKDAVERVRRSYEGCGALKEKILASLGVLKQLRRAVSTYGGAGPPRGSFVNREG